MNDVTILAEMPPVTSDAAADAAIARMGQLARELSRIETTKAELIAAATATAEGEATPRIAERDRLEAKVAAWCAQERARLTGNGSTKTVGFSAGTVAWRLGRPTVEIDKALEEKILEALYRNRGFSRFIKVTETPSKSAMQNATDKEKAVLARIKGIRFVPGGEAFTITPAGAELADRPQTGGD